MATIPTVGSAPRIRSIDVLRGAIMIIMAIDHVRVYSGIPSWSTDYGIFFTRWITNFCAPGFTFLAGTAAFLYGRKTGSKSGLSRYLLTRGLLLVTLELTIIRFFWTFNWDLGQFALAGIIWMLGWCMVILAALVWLRPLTIGIAGLFIIFGQDIFALLPRLLPAEARAHAGYFWDFIYPTGLHPWPVISILYVIVPWIGVMMTGFGFGLVMVKDPVRRAAICKWVGWVAIAAFLLGGIWVTATRHQDGAPFIQQLLGQRKYPASQLFLLMTLGPLIALFPVVERWRGRAPDVVETFGKVPFFYYAFHILLIHMSALLIDWLREGINAAAWYATAPYVELDAGHHWPLWLLYMDVASVVFVLYWLCRWYAGYKREHPEKKWLRYM